MEKSSRYSPPQGPRAGQELTVQTVAAETAEQGHALGTLGMFPALMGCVCCVCVCAPNVQRTGKLDTHTLRCPELSFSFGNLCFLIHKPPPLLPRQQPGHVSNVPWAPPHHSD